MNNHNSTNILDTREWEDAMIFDDADRTATDAMEQSRDQGARPVVLDGPKRIATVMAVLADCGDKVGEYEQGFGSMWQGEDAHGRPWRVYLRDAGRGLMPDHIGPNELIAPRLATKPAG